MLKKINDIALAAYLGVTGFVSDLKKDERGLSGVVVAVLLILVAVLAIVFLWDSLSDWLDELWTKITEGGNSIA